MNTFIQNQVKGPKRVSFATELFGSTTHRVNAVSPLVYACNVRTHAERVNPLSHPGEQKPHGEHCKSQYILEANGYGI